jgi:hypothetical protein
MKKTFLFFCLLVAVSATILPSCNSKEAKAERSGISKSHQTDTTQVWWDSIKPTYIEVLPVIDRPEPLGTRGGMRWTYDATLIFHYTYHEDGEDHDATTKLRLRSGDSESYHYDQTKAEYIKDGVPTQIRHLRTVFWDITHASTDSLKLTRKITFGNEPEIKTVAKKLALKEKYFGHAKILLPRERVIYSN